MRLDLNIQDNIEILNSTQRTISIIGGKGTGKTTTLKLFMENYRIPEIQNNNFNGMLILDPLGIYKSKKLNGMRFLIKTIPPKQEIKEGAIKINTLLKKKINIVLSFVKCLPEEMTTFTDSFFPYLNLHNSFIAIDEIHEFCPQDKETYSKELERYIRHCRNDNVGIIMTSQRPAAVHKNILALTDYLILYRLTWSHDLKAISEILSKHFKDKKELDLFLKNLSTKGFMEGSTIDFRGSKVEKGIE